MGVVLKFDEQNLSDKNFGKADVIKYGFIDYIQGDGNSCLDTGFSGYRINMSDTPGDIPDDLPKIEIEGIFVNVREGDYHYPDSYIFGPYDEPRGTTGRFYGGTCNVSGRGATFEKQGYEIGSTYKLVYGSVYSYLNDDLVSDNSDGHNQYRINAYPENIHLLSGIIPSTSDQKCSIQKIKSFRGYIGNKIMVDLRPYRKTDGTVCMFDMISRKYIYSKGSGTLLGA